METRRWEGDERGVGVASAAPFAPGVDALRARLDDHAWVAEDPHAHLLPHIARACVAVGDVAVDSTRVTEDGVLEVVLDWRPHEDSPALGSRIFELIGSFAESSTHVVQRVLPDAVEYDVITGMLPEHTPFREHGHLVRLRVPGPPPYG